MKKLLLFIIIINIYVLLLFSVALSYSNITTEKIFLMLPQIICIVYFFYLKKKNHGPLIDLLNVSLFFRYLVIPMLIILFDQEYQLENFYHSFYIYICELFCVVCTIIFSIPKKIELKNKIIRLKNKDFIIYLFIFIVILLIIKKPELLSQYNFIFKKNINLNEQRFYSKLDILTIWLRYSIIYIVTKFCYTRFLETKKNKYYLYNLFFLILNMLIIRGKSRFSIMIFLYLLFVITKYLYKKNKDLYKILGVGIFILMYSTFIKFTTNQNINFNNFLSDFIFNIRNNLEIYFSGLKNISMIDKLLKIQENINVFHLFLNDTFSSVMFFSKFVNFEDTTIVNFNYAIYNHKDYQDQIVPLALQSYSYFGPIFFPILIVIYTYFLVKLDSIFLKTQNLDYSYLIVLIGFTLSNFMMTNHTIVFSSIINLLPMSVIFFINRKFYLKSKI